MSPPREQENELENLCFVAQLDRPQLNECNVNEDLVPQNDREKVVRKGSFKTLRPKADSSSKSERSSNEKSKEPLREMIVINSNNKAGGSGDRDNEEEDELGCRKTVPKMAERPPLRPRQPQRRDQTTPQHKGSYQPTERIIYIEEDRPRQEVGRGLEQIEREIEREEQSLSALQQSVIHPKT